MSLGTTTFINDNIQHNNIEGKNLQHNNIQHNNIQHSNVQQHYHNDLKHDVFFATLRIIISCAVVVSVAYFVVMLSIIILGVVAPILGQWECSDRDKQLA
jgi:hypothetical protein